MGLSFVLGRAGSGKTTRCLQDIRQAVEGSRIGPPLILLVPEQATFEMEAALTRQSGAGGMIRAGVLSFRRLAWQVMKETGGAARGRLSETGRRMVLRALLELGKGNLRLFGRAAARPGFSERLAGTIGELKTYCIGPDDLLAFHAASPAQRGLLEDKLHDLVLLYRSLNDHLSQHHTDPDDYLDLLAQGLPGAASLQGARIWVDGFAGFTPQEFRVLEALLQHCAEVTIALCIEPDQAGSIPDEQDPFYKAHRTYQELIELAGRLGAAVCEPRIMPVCHRFAGRKDLAHIEESLNLRPRRPFDGTAENIRLVAAHNRRAEVESAARAIIALTRDEGFRWRDIAVYVRNLPDYADLIEHVFRDFDIPVFLDYKRPMLHHPVSELARSALETVVSRWAYAPVFHYLKTDLTGLARDEVDELENYVLAHGIRGLRWIDGRPWTYRRRYSIGEDEPVPGEAEMAQLERINAIRARASDALAGFEREVATEPTVTGISTALIHLFQTLGVEETLADWATLAQEKGRLDRARVHVQAYNGLIGLLDEMVEAFGDRKMTPERYLQILEAGLEGLKLGLIPPGLDQVFAGSLDRSRNPDSRAVFLLGVNEGVIPSRAPEAGVFTDVERERLLERGLRLADSEERRLFDEQYLVYLGLTRASEHLTVSYALADQEGSGLAPSTVINDLKSLFPGLEPANVPLEPVGDEHDLSFLAHPIRARSYLAGRLRESIKGAPLHPVWYSAYNWLLEHDPGPTRHVLSALFYRNDGGALSPQTAAALFENGLRAGITQVELFNACPFAHFARYGLSARERPRFAARPPEFGMFFHAAVKQLVEALPWPLRPGEGPDEHEIRHMVDTVADRLVPQLHNEFALSSARQRYLVRKLKGVLHASMLALAEQSRRGGFVPVALERGFGYSGELPPLKLDVPGRKLELIGRIDRIDKAEAAGRTFLRVIDYKSGYAGLDLGDVYYGLKLQLLSYLQVAVRNAERLVGTAAEPAGMLYYKIQKPVISANAPLEDDQLAREMLKQFKMNGLVLNDSAVIELIDAHASGYSPVIPVFRKTDGTYRETTSMVASDQFESLFSHLDTTLKQSFARMADGEVAIRPFRRQHLTACRNCPFKPVCQFDPGTGNRYRNLVNLPHDELWQSIKREGKGGNADAGVDA